MYVYINIQNIKQSMYVRINVGYSHLLIIYPIV